MPDPTRRLAAILSADIEGYSRLMAHDEDATIRAVTARREQVGLLVEQHRGRVVDFVGDNFMAEFGSAVNALECAMEIQQVGEELNANLPADRKLVFRIGLHLGEVQVQDDRLFGTGVNIAARLEALGEAGGVSISSQVHREVAGRTNFSFRDLGEHQVKNIPERVHAYAVGPPGAAMPWVLPRFSAVRRSRLIAVAVVVALSAGGWWVRQRGLDEPNTGLPNSLVVLPFDDLSPGGDQEYFAHGMSDELIGELARTPGLEVKGRMTGAAIKRAGLDIPQIAEQLGVTGIIDGSVRRMGDRLRIAVQIISVADSTNVWAQTFERPLNDVFALQTEIARAVAAALDTNAAEEAREPTHSVRAYELYLEGKRVSRQLDARAMARAVELLNQAVSIDPDFADAHASLGNVQTNQCVLGFEPCAQALPRAETAVEVALRLDDGSVRGWIARGMVRGRQYRWSEAEAAFQQAVDLNPTDSDSHLTLGVHLNQVGRIDEGFTHYDRALELDPLNPVTLLTVGSAYNSMRRDHDRAIELSDIAARGLSRPSAWITILQTLAHARAGRLREAAQAFASLGLPAEALEPVEAAAKSGKQSEFFGSILSVMVAASGRPCTQSVMTGASLRLSTGDIDGAMACLQEAYENGTLLATSSLFAPIWDPVRDDARFQQVLRGMKLPPSGAGAL